MQAQGKMKTRGPLANNEQGREDSNSSVNPAWALLRAARTPIQRRRGGSGSQSFLGQEMPRSPRTY